MPQSNMLLLPLPLNALFIEYEEELIEELPLLDIDEVDILLDMDELEA